MENENAQTWGPATMAQKHAWHKALLADRELSPSAKIVAGRLMYFHNDATGQCNPRQQSVADAVGLTRKAVNRLLGDLVARGWISSTQTRGASHYRLNVDRAEGKDTAEVPPKKDSRHKSHKCVDKCQPGQVPLKWDTRCRSDGTAGAAEIGQQVPLEWDTEPPIEPSKGTTDLNDSPDGRQIPAVEIGSETAPEFPNSIMPAQANDNGDPAGFDFLGVVLRIPLGGLDVLTEAFPELDMLAQLPEIDAMIAAGPALPAAEAMSMARNILRTRNRKAAGRQARV